MEALLFSHDGKLFLAMRGGPYMTPVLQLCKLAQRNALNKVRDKISKDDIDSVWGEYGSKRIADLVAEHKHQCNDVEELINGFRGEHGKMSRDNLFRCINNKILSHMNVYIDKKVASSPMEVAIFLFRIGFLTACSEDGDGYEHYSFREMPDLLSSRTSNDFNMQWEIHPCYRQALDIKKINRSQRIKRATIDY